tara:strand:+ start:4936 stop:5244 length:309 start_codon:yes stop_codon:yes gene_type:complete
MKAYAWRTAINDLEVRYNLQVDQIKGKRKLNKVLKLLSDWDIIGEGFNKRTQEYTYIFSRSFRSAAQWHSWAKSFPIHLTETTSHGTDKIRNKQLIQQGALL